MAVKSVKEKVAIVTGAAVFNPSLSNLKTTNITQSGMGAALSKTLIALGWRVACVDIQSGPGTLFTGSLGPNAAFFQADVSSYSSQAAMFTAVWEQWGRIDALCANAGIADRSSLYILSHRDVDSIPPEPDLSCTDVDYKGVIYGTQLAIHFMRKNPMPGGKIVATASVAGLFPFESKSFFSLSSASPPIQKSRC
jgi:NAD(P)-dependent dehydrogenase (short-subunit alcohol dehydrogenase family)